MIAVIFLLQIELEKYKKFFNYPWHIMNEFKKIYISKHRIFNKSNTHIILMLEKCNNMNFKNNNITIFEKVYYKYSYGTVELFSG